MSAKQKAIQKQADQEAARKKREEEEAEKREAAAWKVGSKDESRAKAEEEKEAEKRRKAAEKAALQAAEEAELSGVARVAKPAKKKGKDDFDMLKAALAQQPKTKAQKAAEEKKKQDEERRKKEEEARERKEQERKAQEDMIKKAAAKGIVVNHTDDLFVPLNNHLEEDDFEHTTGLDDAVDLLSGVMGGTKIDEHPERRQKALYNAYFDAQLPILKEEQPGLKLSQYKERIFEMWKTSPENPRNQKLAAEDPDRA